MRSSTITALCALALLGHLAGCQAITQSEMFESWRPNPNDYADASDDPAGEWKFVGDEGRADQGPVVESDQWFKHHIMSPRARSIEQNLGIY